MKKKIMFSIIYSSFVILIAGVSLGATVYVDDDGLCDGNTPCYTTIGAGISAADNGDTIYVYNGTYYENIIVYKSIDLIGQNRDSTIIDGGGIGDVVRVHTGGTTVSNFSIVGSGSNGDDHGIAAITADNVIADNYVAFNQYGISVRLFGNRVVNNECRHISSDAITIEPGSYSNSIENNYISDSDCGIVVSNSDSNEIVSNTIDSTGYGAIVLKQSSNGNNVSHNVIHSGAYLGIQLGGSCNSNVLRGNDIYNFGTDGIHLGSNCQDNTICCNSVAANSGYGIHLWNMCSGNIIYHNNFRNNLLGNASDFNPLDTNFWDNNYPSGGNYWDDFDEPGEGAYDEYHGDSQDEEGGDGIVDLGPPSGGLNAYNIPVDSSQDRYALISQYYPGNVGAVWIVSPPGVVYVDSSYIPRAVIRNFGPDSVGPISVVCTIDTSGNQVYVDSAEISTVGGNDLDTASFDIWTVPTAYIDYAVTVWTEYPDDPYPANDTVAVDIRSIVAGTFIRGDANADLHVDISDPYFIAEFLYHGGDSPPCFDAADPDDDGIITMADMIYILQYLCIQGAPPFPPYPYCGIDPTPDGLDCDSHPCFKPDGIHHGGSTEAPIVVAYPGESDSFQIRGSTDMVPIATYQVSMNFNPNVLSIDSLTLDGCVGMGESLYVEIDSTQGWFTAIRNFGNYIPAFTDSPLLNVWYTTSVPCGYSFLDLADSTQPTGRCSLECVYTNQSGYSLFPTIADGILVIPCFIRGDADEDNKLTMADGIFILKYLYVPGSPPPSCFDAADPDDDGIITMADGLCILKYLYVPGSPPPLPPFPECGPDTTEDELDCQHHPCINLFIRGDCDENTNVDTEDVACIETYLAGGSEPSCMDAADVDDDGDVDQADVTYLYGFLNFGGPPPPPPFPNCGPDTTADPLCCMDHPCNPDRKIANRKSSYELSGGKVTLESPVNELDRIVIPVHLSNRVELSAFAFTIEFDPAIFECEDVLGGTAVHGFDFFSSRWDLEPGKLSLGAVPSFDFSHAIPAGTHRVADIVFRVNSDSRKRISLGIQDVELIDSEGRLLKAETQGIMILVSPSMGIPQVFALSQNYPNPARNWTVIHYQLPKATRTTLRIYNLAGQLVKTLVNEKQNPGYYRVDWDGKDAAGMKVASGVYFYRIEAGEFSSAKKMLLLH